MLEAMIAPRTLHHGPQTIPKQCIYCSRVHYPIGNTTSMKGGSWSAVMFRLVARVKLTSMWMLDLVASQQNIAQIITFRPLAHLFHIHVMWKKTWLTRPGHLLPLLQGPVLMPIVGAFMVYRGQHGHSDQSCRNIASYAALCCDTFLLIIINHSNFQPSWWFGLDGISLIALANSPPSTLPHIQHMTVLLLSNISPHTDMRCCYNECYSLHLWLVIIFWLIDINECDHLFVL